MPHNLIGKAGLGEIVMTGNYTEPTPFTSAAIDSEQQKTDWQVLAGKLEEGKEPEAKSDDGKPQQEDKPPRGCCPMGAALAAKRPNLKFDASPNPHESPKRSRLEQHPTQDQVILNLLITAHPVWVPVPKILATGISQYSSRIWTLRHKRGYDIENRLVDLPGGRKGGEFRLKSLLPNPEIAASPALVPSSPTPRTSVRKPVPQPSRPAVADGLFANDPAWNAENALQRQLRERRDD